MVYPPVQGDNPRASASGLTSASGLSPIISGQTVVPEKTVTKVSISTSKTWKGRTRAPHADANAPLQLL